jgi:hypothetical protein
MEHRSLVQWLAEDPRRGQLLGRSRWVNLQDGLALYCIAELGLSDGRSFALVRGREIIVFDAWCESVRGTRPKVCEVSIGRVSVRGSASLSQLKLVNLIEASLSSHIRLEEFPFAFPFYEPFAINSRRIRWEIRA